jgi:predicted acetyltransferase
VRILPVAFSSLDVTLPPVGSAPYACSMDQKNLPVDAQSAETLTKDGLRLTLVDTADEALFHAWLQADMRGFHGPMFDEKTLTEWAVGIADRRTTGVYDDSSADPTTPVGTVNSWATPLTVPGGDVSGWGVSSVTVAPTHRRRGIARALLESELRTASALKMPLVMITVSEATIYERFGFAPAAFGTDLEIATKRARWAGPTAPGRVQLVPLETMRAQAEAIVEAARLRTPGEIGTWSHLWDRTFRISATDSGAKNKVRAVRYDDERGTPQGFALYVMKESEQDYGSHTAEIITLISATDDAYNALWRFLLDLDLTSTLTAHLRSVDEPLLWQVADKRGVRARHFEHLWLRILDVPAALQARTYSAPLSLSIQVTDPYGFAAGKFSLSVDGAGRCFVTTDTTRDDADLTMSVNELGALYLGGVSAVTLVRAGRVQSNSRGAAAAFDQAFRSKVAPWLSVWF